MITREQVADLRAGDVVELTGDDWGGSVIRGPLTRSLAGDLLLRAGEVGPYQYLIRHLGGGVPVLAKRRTLTVISRAPRPVYKNFPREEPVAGDVVGGGFRAAALVWVYNPNGPWGVEAPWRSTRDNDRYRRDQLPEGLLLLIDGETGRVVPS